LCWQHQECHPPAKTDLSRRPGQAVIAIAKQNIVPSPPNGRLTPQTGYRRPATIETIFTFTRCSIQDVLTLTAKQNFFLVCL